jgi:hypothetical protein
MITETTQERQGINCGSCGRIVEVPEEILDGRFISAEKRKIAYPEYGVLVSPCGRAFCCRECLADYME